METTDHGPSLAHFLKSNDSQAQPATVARSPDFYFHNGTHVFRVSVKLNIFWSPLHCYAC